MHLFSSIHFFFRIYYDNRIGQSKTKSKAGESITPQQLHLLRSFPFTNSTPAPEVSEILTKAFLKEAPLIPTTSGLISSLKSYLPNHGIEQFVDLPVTPKLPAADSRLFSVLLKNSMLQELSIELLIKQLKQKPLIGEYVILWNRSIPSNHKSKRLFSNYSTYFACRRKIY